MTTLLNDLLRGLLFFCFMAVGLTAPIQADTTISGSDAPEFQQALALWLEADEVEALPQLAALAEQGNVAARVLLGLIDKSAALQGPHLTYLPREQRIALLRKPGGMSGRNWMTEATDESALARLWVELWQMQGGLELAERFAELGEDRSCRESLLTHVARQERGFAEEVRAASWFPEALTYLTLDRALSLPGAEALPAGHPMRALAGEDVTHEALRDWLAQDKIAAPLRSVCLSACPQTVQDCTLALYNALGSFSSLAMMGSPAVALVSEADFSASARGHQAVARRIMLMHPIRVRELMLGQVAAIDACSADWLRAQYDAYKPVLRSAPVAPD